MADDDDPLAQYRRRPRPPEPDKPDNPRFYEAYQAQDRVQRLDIRRTSGASHCPATAYLLDIIYGARFHTSFILVFNFCTVTVKGKNLHDMVQALRLGRCAALTEYHPEIFDPPAPGAPIITRIDIVLPKERQEAIETDAYSKGQTPEK